MMSEEASEEQVFRDQVEVMRHAVARSTESTPHPGPCGMDFIEATRLGAQSPPRLLGLQQAVKAGHPAPGAAHLWAWPRTKRTLSTAWCGLSARGRRRARGHVRDDGLIAS